MYLLLYIISGISQRLYLIERLKKVGIFFSQLVIWLRYTRWFLPRTIYTFLISEGDGQESFLPISIPSSNTFYQVIHLLHPRENNNRNYLLLCIQAYKLKSLRFRLSKKWTVFWNFKERTKWISVDDQIQCLVIFWFYQGKLRIC